MIACVIIESSKTERLWIQFVMAVELDGQHPGSYREIKIPHPNNNWLTWGFHPGRLNNQLLRDYCTSHSLHLLVKTFRSNKGNTYGMRLISITHTHTHTQKRILFWLFVCLGRFLTLTKSQKCQARGISRIKGAFPNWPAELHSRTNTTTLLWLSPLSFSLSLSLYENRINKFHVFVFYFQTGVMV
jgi:hypothetical protein